MFEKVNPAHPDKVADRIAGAVVDIAYDTQIDPKVAVEVLIGHGICHIIAETSAAINREKVTAAVQRIAGDLEVDLWLFPRIPILLVTRKMPFAAVTMVSLRVCL